MSSAGAGGKCLPQPKIRRNFLRCLFKRRIVIPYNLFHPVRLTGFFLSPHCVYLANQPFFFILGDIAAANFIFVLLDKPIHTVRRPGIDNLNRVRDKMDDTVLVNRVFADDSFMRCAELNQVHDYHRRVVMHDAVFVPHGVFGVKREEIRNVAG